MGKIKDLIKEHALSIAKIILIILMITFIVFSISKEIKSINFAETVMLIKSFSIFSITILVILGILSIALITLYDFAIIKYLRLDIRPITIFTISYLATTINNVSGLGGLTGASIRAIFFKKDDNNTDILDYNLLQIPATAIGLSVLIAISILNYEYISPIIHEYRLLLFGIIGFLIYLLGYFFIDKLFYLFKKTKIELTSMDRIFLRAKLLIASILEWILAYILFTIIIRHFNNNINYRIILGIFSLASMAGIITMLPGGVGSFDLVALVGFQYYGIPSEHILASLVLYRIFYYILPLIVSIVFTLIVQTQGESASIKILNTDKLKVFINRTSSLTNVLLSILIFFSGSVLLVSALVPGITERVKLADTILSFSILQWSHQLSICIGILLITVSRDIRMKVKGAYKITWWLLLLGAIFTFLKGFDYEEAIFLGIVLILLRASKSSFFRKSLPFDWFRTILSSIGALIGVGIYMQLSHKIIWDFLNTNSIKDIFVHGINSFRPSGIFTYGTFILYLVIKELTKERIINDNRYEKVDEIRLSSFLEDYSGTYLSHLLYLKDKHIFWSKNNKVAIAFEKSHHIIISLGDPFGDSKYFGEAIDEFHMFIDEYGYKSIFYEASDNLLSLYHEHGYYFFKLGETGLVNLNKFDLSSPNSRDFRNVISRFTRDGYSFTLQNAGEIDDKLYDELLLVSDEWLNGRNEMGFSLGFMNREYIEASPLVLVRKNDTNELIAFASLMPKYDNASFSIDLMRFKEKTPKNTMTFLIINLIKVLKEEGYEILNLGMAPLSNVGMNYYSHYREKLAHLVFKYGREIYNFGGLRGYKEKFNPSWEGRYLAFEDLTLLPASIIEVTMLIHRNKR